MNKEKKLMINMRNALNVLSILKTENCWDPYDTQFMSSQQCINYIQKSINEYFSLGQTILLYWNNKTYLKIFEDKNFLNMIIYLMKEFNYNKELEKNNN